MKRRSVIIGGALVTLVAAALLVLRAPGVDRGQALEDGARAALEAGRADEAVTQLEALARLEPDRPGLNGLRGRALTSAGDPVRALPLLTAATAADPSDLEALEFNAVALAQLGRHGDARELLERAVALDRSQSRLWRRLAQVRLVTQQVPGAVEAWQQARRATPAEAPEIDSEARALLTAAGHVDQAGLFGADGG